MSAPLALEVDRWVCPQARQLLIAKYKVRTTPDRAPHRHIPLTTRLHTSRPRTGAEGPPCQGRWVGK
jgi:hypothetical protein